MKSGVILIDKPEGISSAQVVGIARKRLGIKKIGHAGTLDPMATGLLVLLTNRATRLAQYAEGGTKQYSGTIQLGARSDTDDRTGQMEWLDVSMPDFMTIESAVSQFLGSIEQIPPKVSAVKINGKRAYKRARQGEDFVIKSRRVEIHSFTVAPAENNQLKFNISCSKGTYIRSLARDLGEVLGVGGCLHSLRREGSRPFLVENAVSLDTLGEDDILNWDILFPNDERVALSPTECAQLLQGDNRPLQNVSSKGDASRLLYCNEQADVPVGLLERSDHTWKIAVNLGAENLCV